jgi:hypothetical protein
MELGADLRAGASGREATHSASAASPAIGASLAIGASPAKGANPAAGASPATGASPVIGANPAAGASSASPVAGTGASVFGLDVRAEVPLELLWGAAATPTGRKLDISVARGDDAAARNWPSSAELVCDQRELDGTVSFRIEAHPQAGYLISGPAYGSHVLSPDGQRVLCVPGARAEHAWQRLLIAQVLPFAALLHGLEVLHASAVVSGGRAVALIGPSHAGKTSVALELCRLGADFLADDVLALEQVGPDLLSHPGTAIAGLNHAEAQRLECAGDPRPEGVVAINDRERLLRMRGATEPARLGALFLLERRADGPDHPCFEPATDARLLLSATFNSVLTDARRLQRLLEVCAIAARLQVERVLAGPDVNPTQIATAIARRLGDPL